MIAGILVGWPPASASNKRRSTPDRLAQRNGHRPRVLSTATGDLELRIPKLRAGSFFPSLLERRRVDQALFAEPPRRWRPPS